jgi:dolichol-phosphate mannosyltransferase
MQNIAIVVPCYNEEEVLNKFYINLLESIKALPYNFIIIFIDDGSQDRTWEVIKNLKSIDHVLIKGVQLLINSGHAIALQAGYEYAEDLKVNAVISMDSDLQHPPKYINDFLKKWEKGYKLVKGIRQETVMIGRFKNLSSKLFYKIINKYSNIKLLDGEADYRLVDIDILSKINKLPEYPKFYRGLFSLINNSVEYTYFIADKRVAGSSKYNFSKMFDLARIAFVSFSDFPLKMILYFGIASSFLAILALIFSIAIKFMFGFSFISNTVVILFFIILVLGILVSLIGILALYFIEFSNQVRGRPAYWKSSYF